MDTSAKGNTSSQNPKVQSFLESLRNRSLSSSPRTQENQPSPYESFGEKLRLQEQRKQEFFRSRTKEFNEVYSLKKRQETSRITELQTELQKVAQSMGKLDKELDIAISQAPIQTGTYQVSVMEHLKIKLKEFQLKVDRASTWLHHFNNRKDKQSYFWAQAASKGTKFTLSEERQVSMSIG